MNQLKTIQQKYSPKTEISAAAYSAAKERLSEEEFERSYLMVWVDDTVRKYYQVGQFNQEDAKLLMLEEIRQNTQDTKRYTKYIWYFIVTSIVLSVVGLLLTMMANS